ncbi:MAG: hypothetical protein R3299_02620 [Arenibacter sp.]|nr:hypothetical protein [Arenibacter sp.]
MLYRVLSYIRFWLASTNQHGVHSPFIYNFVTKCLYKPPYYPSPKSTAILLKSLDYFKLKEVQLVGDNEALKKRLSSHGITITAQNSKLLCLDSLNKTILDKYVVGNPAIKNGSIIYVPAIYRNEERNTFWKTLQQLEVVTVSMDMYFGGLLFIRQEQAREHFKIRV